MYRFTYSSGSIEVISVFADTQPEAYSKVEDLDLKSSAYAELKLIGIEELEPMDIIFEPEE